MTQEIQVKDLQATGSITNTASLLALTDSTNNTVNLISKNDFVESLVSSTANNGLSADENGLVVANIGNLSDLQTTVKSSVVDAINETVGSINSLQNQPITVLETSGTIALADNSINSITPTGNVTFTLPTITDNTVFHQILVQMNLSTVYTIDVGATNYFNYSILAFDEVGQYNIIYEYDSIAEHWVVGAIGKGV